MINKLTLLFLIVISLFSCKKDDDPLEGLDSASNIVKPKGVYTSSFGNATALDHNQVKGSLVRVKWSDLEPEEGVYDFSKIEEFRSVLLSKNLHWSLGIIAGGDSPDWLIADVGADYFEIVGVDDALKKIPKIWDPKVNDRLALLANALANVYGNDDRLVLIYVPQMTANGIEGHFNGVPFETLVNVGLTADNWVSAVKASARLFANAFTTKAIAVEVHDIMGDSSIPYRIMTDLWNDVSLNHRVGAAMWWISGKTTYQENLVEALTEFPGDIYAQAIGRSDQVERFRDNDYTTIFEQAREINIRYIELWEYEYVNNTFSQDFENFNNYANSNFE